MEITAEQWEHVRDAYERGRRMDGHQLKLHDWQPGDELDEMPFDVVKSRGELLKLQKYVHKLSPHTLTMIEGNIVADVNEAVLLCEAYHQNGRPGPSCAHKEAIAQLSSFWRGATKRGMRRDNEFNGYVRWLGRHLRKLEPMLKTESAACFAAWNAIGALSKSY